VDLLRPVRTWWEDLLAPPVRCVPRVIAARGEINLSQMVMRAPPMQILPIKPPALRLMVSVGRAALIFRDERTAHAAWIKSRLICGLRNWTWPICDWMCLLTAWESVASKWFINKYVCQKAATNQALAGSIPANRTSNIEGLQAQACNPFLVYARVPQRRR